MDVEDHVAIFVADGCVRMGGCVVQEPEDFVVVVVRGFGLLGEKGSKCDQHRWINGNGIIQKDANDLLDQVDYFRTEESRRVGVVGVFYGCTIDGLLSGMGGVFSALRGWVLEFVQYFGEVVGHQNFVCPKAIVPGDCDHTVQGASSVNINFVHIF